MNNLIFISPRSDIIGEYNSFIGITIWGTSNKHTEWYTDGRLIACRPGYTFILSCGYNKKNINIDYDLSMDILYKYIGESKDAGKTFFSVFYCENISSKHWVFNEVSHNGLIKPTEDQRGEIIKSICNWVNYTNKKLKNIFLKK